ncbi:MAG: helix-hairpin-helix domain-containing protein [Candidatus Aminicenantes bacterium]|nr:MAG: helix-hairpin-helix domain-containing protein [Candidatus Aminicenantes bacterium]
MKKLVMKGFVLSVLLCFVFSTALPVLAQANSKAKEKKININTASLEELQELPRIGVKVAQRIIDFRLKNGKFKKIEEIMKVRGVGEKVFKQIKDLITVGNIKAKK